MNIFNTDIEKVKTEYLEKVLNESRKYDAVYIYGAGSVAKLLHSLLTSQGVQMEGFCVTDMHNNQKQIAGLSVRQIDEIEDKDENTLFVIGTLLERSSAMVQMLEGNGYTHYILPPENVNYFNNKKIEVRERPTLEITPKIGCGVHCRYCPQDVLYKEYFADKCRTIMMDLELYKRCIDKTPMNCIIIFAGFVEPFLNPQAVEMIQYAAETGRDVSLYTTLVGMSMEQFEQIKNIPFYEVVLHTPDDEMYANIPLTEEYFKLLDVVLDAKKPDGSRFIDWANCQGVPHREVLKHTNGKLLITNELVDRAGNITYEEVYENSSKKGRIVCERAKRLNHNILLPDGSVVLCCMDFGMKHVLGNLDKQEYDDLFTGEEMQKIKRAMNDDRIEIICRQCSSAIEM